MKTAQLLAFCGMIILASCKHNCPEPNPEPNPVVIYTLSTTLGSETQGAPVVEHYPTTSFPTHPEVFIGKWTHGSWYRHRYLLKPDLSSIPANATIDSAFVIFYPVDNATTPSGGGQDNNIGSNAIFIEKVTSSWTSSTVAWNNQPTTTTTGRVPVAATASGNNINSGKIYLTNLVQGWVSTPSTYFGMMLKAQDETTDSYRRVLYASPFNSDSSVRPVFKVYYTK